MFHILGSVAYTDYSKDKAGNKHYDYPDIWTSFAKDGLRTVFLWSTLALAVILLAVGLFVWYKNRERFNRFLSAAITIAIGYAAAIIVTMFSLEIMDMRESGNVIALILYPTIALGACVIAGAIALYISTFYGKTAQLVTRIIVLSLAAAALVAVLVCLGVYFSKNVFRDGYYDDPEGTASVNQVALYLGAVAIIAVIAFLALFIGRKDKRGFDSRSVAYAAVCIALSFALSYVRLFKLPQGGSVTVASLLPLMLYSYMFGVRKGVFVGFVYGLLQAVQDPYIIHPAQFMLDYPIAFSAIGLAGAFSKVDALKKAPQAQFLLGAAVASVLRYASHVLSGVFAFSAYAADAGMAAWPYSLIYNSFVFADIAIVMFVGAIVFSSRSFMATVRKSSAEKPAKESETATQNAEQK